MPPPWCCWVDVTASRQPEAGQVLRAVTWQSAAAPPAPQALGESVSPRRGCTPSLPTRVSTPLAKDCLRSQINDSEAFTCEPENHVLSA